MRSMISRSGDAAGRARSGKPGRTGVGSAAGLTTVGGGRVAVRTTEGGGVTGTAVTGIDVAAGREVGLAGGSDAATVPAAGDPPPPLFSATSPITAPIA